MNISWNGVYPALTTAFDVHGNLDIPGLMHNVEAQITAGVDGLILAGSLGESSTLRQEERLQLLTETLDFVKGRVPVLLNIAEGSTNAAMQLAVQAAAAGADGLMVLPPMMYKPTDAETVMHFSAVAKSTDLPILVYNNPVDYKVEVSLDMLEELLQFDSIQAIKESTRDVSNVTRMKARFGDRLKILCGVDTLALEELLMGADGWVAGLVDAFPRETVAIYRLAKAGRVAEALAIYRWFLPILELDIHPQLVQNIKLAEAMTGLGTEHVRAPRQVLQGAERERVLAILEKGLASRPQLPDYLHL
ncbi:MAG: dihydrodipicolinate synthase family protein [Lewinellaceae bacterium]|nr:dihydrodipicolinate synthase family protein [Lewinellaceae bacterium]